MILSPYSLMPANSRGVGQRWSAAACNNIIIIRPYCIRWTLIHSTYNAIFVFHFVENKIWFHLVSSGNVRIKWKSALYKILMLHLHGLSLPSFIIPVRSLQTKEPTRSFLYKRRLEWSGSVLSSVLSKAYYAALLPRRGRILRRTLSVCLSVCPSVCLSVCPSVCPSVPLSLPASRRAT